jgi:hypothetical protein
MVDGYLSPMSRLVLANGEGSNMYLDGYLGIKPKQGYALSDTNIELRVVEPWHLSGSPPSVAIVASATNRPILDWVTGPNNNIYYITRNAQNQYVLYCHNPFTEEHIPFDPQLPGPGPVVMSRQNLLYIARDGFLGVYPPDPVMPMINSADLPGDIVGDPMVYNDATDQVVAFDGTTEGLASDVVFNGATTRVIHADARYMLWNMDLLDGADHLLQEMGITPSL